MDKQALIIFRGDDGMVRSLEIEIDTELVEIAETKLESPSDVFNEVKRFLGLFEN